MKEPAALNQTEVPRLPAKYRVGKVLSQGAISIVREAMHVNTGQRFAAKVFSKRALGGRAAMLKEEIAMMRRVHHPNCISLVDWFETENSVYLIMELAEGGDLSDRLSRKVFEWEGEAARLVREILLGVEYLHSIGIVHGDLRLENVLLLDTFEDSQLRITGFRGDRYLTDEEHEALVFHGSNAAPEVIQQTGHGKPADMWSVGVIAYMLLCGYEPFPNDGRVTHIDSILSGTYEYQEEYWKGISEQAKSFIDALLIPSAEKRLTATQALAHPWFSATLGQGPATSIHLLPKVNSMNMEALRSALRAARDAQRTQEHDGGGIRDGAALPSSEAGGPDSTAAQAVGTVDEA
ncbi:MAG: kinase-like domain-containing protein [Benniella sp.]|nr:MAG: kinase-like domain-containing protein [Benniella sp.]